LTPAFSVFSTSRTRPTINGTKMNGKHVIVSHFHNEQLQAPAFQFSTWKILGVSTCRPIGGHHKAKNWGCLDTVDTNGLTPDGFQETRVFMYFNGSSSHWYEFCTSTGYLWILLVRAVSVQIVFLSIPYEESKTKLVLTQLIHVMTHIWRHKLSS